jgi:hypothetical protein
MFMTAANAVIETANFTEPSTGQSPDALATADSLGGSTRNPTASPWADHIEPVQAEKADEPSAQLNSACGLGTPSPRDLDNDIGYLHDQFARTIAGRTCLSDSVSALVAFWAISTWFQDALAIIPCLVITGPPHQAMLVLNVLRDLCRRSVPLAEFKRSDLRDFSTNCTMLSSEPFLNNKMAALLGNCTNQGFTVVEQGRLVNVAGSKAVYIGEDPAINKIQHSLYVDVATPPFVNAPLHGRSTKETLDLLQARMVIYRNSNLSRVKALEFNPSGLSLEVTAVANALGSCLVNAPGLQTRLLDLLRPQDQEQIADRCDSIEAIVVAAALNLSHQQKEQVFVKEIAAEVNRLLEARGESMRLNPEKVGH